MQENSNLDSKTHTQTLINSSLTNNPLTPNPNASTPLSHNNINQKSLNASSQTSTEKTFSDSSHLYERATKVIPGGVHSPVRAFKSVGGPPIFMQSAQGAHITDTSGQTYVDFCQAFGPLIFGHQDPDIYQSALLALSKGWCFGAAEPYSLALTEKITQLIPWVEKLRMCVSGTEAVMSALRVARAVTSKTKFLKFEGCYHGHSDSMLVKAGSSLAEKAESTSAGISPSIPLETCVVPLGDIQAVEEAFKEHEFAAIIIEPVPANYGLLPLDANFLSFLRQICTQHGTLLIFDEVISGFRMGIQGASGYYQIEPDLVTFGKVMGAGFNVAAFGGKAQWMDLVAPLGPVYQAGTLSASPLGMIAGLAQLEKLERCNPYSLLRSMSLQIQSHLHQTAQKLSIPLRVQCLESLFWIVFGTNQEIKNIDALPKNHSSLFALFFHELVKLGFYLSPSPYEVCFLALPHEPWIDSFLLACDQVLEQHQKTFQN